MTLHDARHEPAGPGFSDALTYAFADPGGDACGVARLGVADGRVTGLALVFRGGEPVAVAAEAEQAAPEGDRWEAVRAAGLASEELAPLEAWRLRFEGDGLACDLRFEATAPAVELAPDAPAAQAGGMQGFDHVCRVSGTVGGAAFEGRGQRGRSWGAPDWDRMALARTLSAWFDDDWAVTAVAVRPAKARSHADERVAAFLVEPASEGAVHEVFDPRISTTYDGEGRQRRAGLELYVDEEDGYPHRAAGEVVAGTSLDLRAPADGGSGLRLDCAFFRWRMEGRSGVGRYDVLRRAG